MRSRRLGADARDVVRRDLGVDEVVRVGFALEMRAKVSRGHAMAADPLQIEVLRIPRLLDEHDPVGKAAIARLRAVALRLLPMLERRGDEVDLEPFAHEQLGEEPKPRVSFRLVAQLHAHRDDGDAVLAGVFRSGGFHNRAL